MGKNQKMSLAEFQADQNFGEWADDVDEFTYAGVGGKTAAGSSFSAGRDSRPEPVVVPIPDRPPFTARIYNLDYSVDEDALAAQFPSPDYAVASIRAPKDMSTGRARGFAFVEFKDRESLVKSLDLNGTTFLGRTFNIAVSDNSRGGYRADPFDDKTGGDWRSQRRGPLPPLDNEDFPSRGSRGPRPPRPEEQRDFDNWERRGPLPPRNDGFGFGRDRGDRPSRPHQERPEDQRDFDNWERRGPLPSRERPERSFSGGDRRPHREREPEPELDWGVKRTLSPRRNVSGGYKPRGDGERREHREPRDLPVDNADNWRSAKPAANVQYKNLGVKTRSVSGEGKGSLFGEAHPVNTNQLEEEIIKRNKQREQEVLQHHNNHHQKKKLESARRGFDALSVKDDDNDDEAKATETKQKQESAAEAVPEPAPEAAPAAPAAAADDGSWETVKRK